ncbi:ABC-2 family transporter protein [Saccharopolyspora antimicrobica]|uniref:ABC-2 family transporter n=1 Tax=Saccharopolyspora antimicrobica TaxID=455193 RepID=A0A1I4QL99_9PSEU|nr:ABC transporter permease [Saccharopolyspora antimicrobica]RKT88390.1 ABC-2 family transporter [Saccharopolyspora antimicrobica]SFM40829.1 ABC-2 family transporter protein [Saccharopolyspora antimicrobica]
MRTLIANEFRKIRRERFVWAVLALNVAPFAMVVANYAVNGGDPTLERFYFTFHNQYTMVLPLVVCATVAACFHTEFRNGTYFEWLTCGQPKSLLWAAKLVVACLLVAVLAALNHVGLLVFLLVENPGGGLLRMSTAYWLLVGISVASVALLCALLTLVTRNIVIVNIFGIGLTVATLVFMAADFSYLIPTCFAYRLSVGVVVPDAAYPDPGHALVVGWTVTALLVLLPLVANLLVITRRRYLR